jgi:leader peptidase (prepilin peptidase)/N-methyltransferase
MVSLSFITAFAVILAGLITGSFFNVLIWRLPRNESVVFPASHCPACNRPIRPWENIPVLSYLLLRGKCAGCKGRISFVYPLIELFTAAAAIALWYWLGFPQVLLPAANHTEVFHSIDLFIQGFVLLLLIPITVIDVQHYIIPDELTITFLVVALAASFLPGDTTPFQSVLGVLAGGGTLLAIGWIGKIVFRKGEAMGGGDIKLLALAGALWGPKIALLTIFFGSLYGTLGAVILLGLRRLNNDHRIPFGPFLSLGIWTAVLRGDYLLNSYLHFVAGLLNK